MHRKSGWWMRLLACFISFSSQTIQLRLSFLWIKKNRFLHTILLKPFFSRFLFHDFKKIPLNQFSNKQMENYFFKTWFFFRLFLLGNVHLNMWIALAFFEFHFILARASVSSTFNHKKLFLNFWVYTSIVMY